MLPLLLASSSVYRRDLLSRLRLPFTCSSPDIDEGHHQGETAIELVKRLSLEKARALAASHPNHLIIGSDQVAVLDGRIIGKPHTYEKAHQQLTTASGASVSFLTGLTLLNSQTGHYQTDCVPFTVHMRSLSAEQIERYLRAEQPYDCAGSFKCESLGISLFEEMIGQDQTTLMGMPMIKLCHILRELKILVPESLSLNSGCNLCLNL